MNELYRLKYAELSWSIEEYHRGIKQLVGVERCMVRTAIAQRNHIGWHCERFTHRTTLFFDGHQLI